MSGNWASKVLALAIVAGFGFLGWQLLSGFFEFLGKADKNAAAAIIGAAATAIAGVVAVLISQYFTRSREIAHAHRTRKVEMYSEFLTQLTKVMQNTSKKKSYKIESDKELEQHLVDLQKNLILWGGSHVIRAWESFRINSTSGGIDIMLAMDEILRAIRGDIGLSNRLLRKGDLVKIFLKDPREMDELVKQKGK